MDPETLEVSIPTPIDCNDPVFDGSSSSTAINILDRANAGDVGLTVTTLDLATGQFSEGPVVMTFPLCSTCDPVTAAGGGLLWIYDVSTTNGPELLEVSESSGQVLDTVPMPTLYKPLLAANDQGVFVAQSLEGAGSGPALYYVGSGASTPVTLETDPHLVACWMWTSDDVLWIGMGSTGPGGHGCGQQTIWRLDGTNPQPVFQTPAPSGYIPPVVGGKTEGLWSVRWPWPSSTESVPVTPQLIYVNPNTGETTVAATLPPITGPVGDSGIDPGQVVVLDGSLYMLEPPLVPGGNGYDQLIRVSL